jgi:2-polyprenyl-3-methyl-5-hydroxy-6-metoxy-1,4-benzoquinol methylase
VTIKNIEETTEFFIPTAGLEVEPYLALELPHTASGFEIRQCKQAIHHLGRYHWATRVLKDAKAGAILDVACGSGYGSFILAKALPNHQVMGADYDPRAIAHAVANYGNVPNLTYRTFDLETWRLLETGQSAGRFNYIVSFDTIEHLLHREIALVNIAENLWPKGSLLFSTPSGHRENLLNPGWEHHKIEYSHIYLCNLMRRFFRDVLIPDDLSLPELDFWTKVINNGKQRYFLRANPMVCRRPISLGFTLPQTSEIGV